MKRCKFILPMIAGLAMLLTSCGGSKAPTGNNEKPVDPPKPKVVPRDQDETYNVMFIGNSFTYFNDLNQPNGIFANIAKSAGYEKVNVSTIYNGGYYLHQFLDRQDTYGKKVYEALTSSTKYDIVIIQEQSSNAIRNPADFYNSCRGFKELIDKNGAEMWLYATWGYKVGHADLPTYGPTTTQMEMKLRAAYCAIGEELNVPVVHAGAAMTKAHSEYPELGLYRTDYYHPTATASLLIGYTMFGTIFHVNPLKLEYRGTISESNADTLRIVAASIVNNKITVDEAYKTSSIGVIPEVSTAEMLTSVPKTPIISLTYRDSATIGDGWMTCKTNSSKTFSGIRGDKNKIASTEYSSTALTDTQKQDIADKGYGISVIGIDYMDSSKKGTNTTVDAGTFTSVGNLINGHWGESYMSAMVFGGDKFDVSGSKNSLGKYTGLITLNFGKVRKFDAIGYFSGNTEGFPQAQDVFVSEDGETWSKVDKACYDTYTTQLKSLPTTSYPDPWNGNTASTLVAFSMNNTSGKYVRIGIIRGGLISTGDMNLQEINTRELVVFGEGDGTETGGGEQEKEIEVDTKIASPYSGSVSDNSDTAISYATNNVGKWGVYKSGSSTNVTFNEDNLYVTGGSAAYLRLFPNNNIKTLGGVFTAEFDIIPQTGQTGCFQFGTGTTNAKDGSRQKIDIKPVSECTIDKTYHIELIIKLQAGCYWQLSFKNNSPANIRATIKNINLTQLAAKNVPATVKSGINVVSYPSEWNTNIVTE